MKTNEHDWRTRWRVHVTKDTELKNPGRYA